MAEVGTLKLDLRALKCQNPICFRILFYTLESYHNYKNPVGRIDTLNKSPSQTEGDYGSQNLSELIGSLRAGSHFDISISISRHTQTQHDVDN